MLNDTNLLHMAVASGNATYSSCTETLLPSKVMAAMHSMVAHHQRQLQIQVSSNQFSLFKTVQLPGIRGQKLSSKGGSHMRDDTHPT
jgi:hypothetical protein